jgi:hypothetical protein
MRFSVMPDYCTWTFDDRGDGFYFTAEPPADIGAPKYLHDANPWVVLSCALVRLRNGDFGVFPAVVDAMLAENEQALWVSAGMLFAFAAPPSVLNELRRLYGPAELSKYPEMVRQYCKTLCHSMESTCLGAVIDAYRSTQDEDVRVLVAEYLSHIWEDEPGLVAKGPILETAPEPPPPFEMKYYDYDTYERRLRELAARVEPGTRYVLGGATFSVLRLAERILAHARAGEDSVRTNFERMVFEANTGISCRSFFVEDGPQTRFRPLSAAAIVEGFLEDPRSRRFVPGQRYFFGHPVPP